MVAALGIGCLSLLRLPHVCLVGHLAVAIFKTALCISRHAQSSYLH